MQDDTMHTEATVDPATHADPHGEAGEHHHPGWSTYWKVALILGLITVGEVWMYYVPAIVASRVFVPGLLILSAMKFAIVVMFYMHLKYDHKLFRALFTGPLFIAAVTLVSLMFLFGHLVAKLGR
jgi:cytochrome c oxidase subunit 4